MGEDIGGDWEVGAGGGAVDGMAMVLLNQRFRLGGNEVSRVGGIEVDTLGKTRCKGFF